MRSFLDPLTRRVRHAYTRSVLTSLARRATLGLATTVATAGLCYGLTRVIRPLDGITGREPDVELTIAADAHWCRVLMYALPGDTTRRAMTALGTWIGAGDRTRDDAGICRLHESPSIPLPRTVTGQQLTAVQIRRTRSTPDAATALERYAETPRHISDDHHAPHPVRARATQWVEGNTLFRDGSSARWTHGAVYAIPTRLAPQTVAVARTP